MLVTFREQLESGELGQPWALADGIVTFQQGAYVPSSSQLVGEVLAVAHDDGHVGIQNSLHRLRRDFHLPQARSAFQQYIRACTVCQRKKTEQLHLAGLLQPLAVPSRVWEDISMDFIEALPKVGGKNVILAVVDRFSKYAHFIPLAHPYTAESVAKTFFSNIVCLHGFPTSIISNREVVFTSGFWKALFSAAGTRLHMSSAFHLQSDGQSEAVNPVITMYLRCITRDHPRQWLQWLPWAEFCYNTSYHSALKDTPFRVVYGRDPRLPGTILRAKFAMRRWNGRSSTVTSSY